MKALLLAVLCICAIAVMEFPSSGYEDVGGSFGISWLEKYGTAPVNTIETPNNIWNWGNAPKGFVLRNGTLFPPGTVPQWYYPVLITDFTPIVINQSELSSPQLGNSYATDPWLLAQLTGRPVTLVNEPHGTLF